MIDAQGSAVPPERIFLGWESPTLHLAADWLLQRFGESMDGVTIALPGRRAGRRLMELLSQRAAADWVPPSLTTLAQWSDGTLHLQHPYADDTHRDLAWIRALQELDTMDRARLMSEAPASDAPEAWWPWMEMVRSLHQELSAEGWSFRQVMELATPEDAPRWKALAQVQEGFVERLLLEGCVDRDAERLRHWQEVSSVAIEGTLVLLGIADVNRRQRLLLEKLQGKWMTLIAAPESAADGFDAFGLVRPEAWEERPLCLAQEQVVISAEAEGQGQAVHRFLQEHRGDFAAEEITLGVLDEQSLPALCHGLAEEGVGVHAPQGVPGSRTMVARMVAATADWLERQDIPNFAAILRHPDAESWLARLWNRPVDAVALDAYQAEHLAEAAGPDWLGPNRDHKSSVLQHDLVRQQSATLWKATETLRGKPRSLAEWTIPLRDWLMEVYAERDLDRRKESERHLAVMLEAGAEILQRWNRLPKEGTCELALNGVDALRLFARELFRTEIPPRVVAATSVETIGWLELALDDAPLLLITDFQEGRAPAALSHHALLDVPTRARLRLPDESQRWARDRYWLECLTRTRNSSTPPQFFLCRVGPDGNPLQPSRFLFLDQEEGMVRRAMQLFHEEPIVEVATALDLPPTTDLPGPRANLEHETEVFSCSRLNRYLDSPYSYYLEHVLRLERIEEEARELGPLPFGILLHDVLERFARDPKLRDLDQAEAIHKALVPILHEEARNRFGTHPMPMVRLQVAHAETRLRWFAQQQEALYRDGWRIQEAEWSPTGGSVPMQFDTVPFRLRGKIDRIDKRVDGDQIQWRIIDYKTGDRRKTLGDLWQKTKKRWLDVQMALYPQMARELTGGRGYAIPDGNVSASYWNLGAYASNSGLFDLKLDPEMIAELEIQVGDAVRRIRKDLFFLEDQAKRHRSDLAERVMGDRFLEALEEDEGGEL